ncbi:alpha/beta hydrolase fold domain-containing protein [Gordonia sp. CPCC 205515]|uniref:alpha/beta hydrolase fold domain-containing protein n=1 Tax=Gordonia sp. CPCC 205515 TaxID=3140791 RepID=UPI003AF354FA
MSSSTSSRYTAPGRLGDPGLTLGTDPRTDPALLALMATIGLDQPSPPAPDPSAMSVDELRGAVGAADEGFTGLYGAIPLDAPGDVPTEVEISTVTINGQGDQLPIDLHIYRSHGALAAQPGVVYIHGGGMTILPTRSRVHDRWCSDIAAAGSVAISVDFRNAYAPGGNTPFPGGLDDCCRAIDWIHRHRLELGVSSVVLQGESGGANLALATALRAKRDGFLDAIDGVYACVPYVSGGYLWDDERKLRELPSMIENNGYFIDCPMMGLLVATYDPTGEHAEDPLAWPYWAAPAHLDGLPPHVITVNELDPLRDEGLAYYRALNRAGVSVRGRTNPGIVHGAEMIFRAALGRLNRWVVSDIAGFAATLR